MKRQAALVVMGAWLMASICMSVIATENFYTVDRLLGASSNAAFTELVQKFGQPAAREFLRYLSSELNRLYFQMWNIAQLVLGASALWLLGGSQEQEADTAHPRSAGSLGRSRKAVIVMLAIVVLMVGYLTPAIVSLGRELDFVPRDPAPPGMSRFWALHAAYTLLEMVKLLVGAVAAFWIARSRSA